MLLRAATKSIAKIKQYLMNTWKMLFKRKIYSTKDNINVYNNRRYQWLTFNQNDIQTLINLSNPTQPELNYIPPMIACAQHNPGNVCLLGLGGAAIAHALDKFMTNYTLTAVEYNHNVIDIAQKYFMTAQIDCLKIIHDDARLHLKHTLDKYQHILVDLYDPNNSLEAVQNAEFFLLCKSRLLSNGILAINIVNFADRELILCHLREIFHLVTLPVKNAANTIVLAYAGESINDLLDQLYKYKIIQNIMWDKDFGCIAW
jgi:spermidine synthase